MIKHRTKNLICQLLARHKVLEACVIAFFIIIVVFPDVIFLGASFRLTDQVAASQNGLLAKTFYRIPITSGWWGGYNDNGGAIYQSEPMIEFMRFSIQNGHSPYWNPYSAAGSLGPETLVDQKFSAFTLINAILGGGSAIYNATMLLLYFFAVFFLYRIARERLQLSVLSGIGISLFYLLNGYSTANFGSNVAQSYLFVPMCLYVSFTFIDKATIARFVAVVLSFTIFLSCTFIPTTVTSIIAIYAIILGFVFTKIGHRVLNYREGVMLIILQSMGVFLSVTMLAVLYLPIFENIRSTGTLEAYSSRIFYPINFPQGIASLYSPTHLYESYNAMETAAINWNDGITKNGIAGNTIFHMGVIAITLSGCAFCLRRNIYNRMVIVCTLCVILVFFRLFEPVFIERLMSHIPVIGKIGCQYWWPAVMFPMAFLVGFGIENLQRHNARIMPAIFMLIIGVFSILYVFEIYGLRDPNIEYKLQSLILLGGMTVGVIALLLTLRFKKKGPLAGMIITVLVSGLFLELIVDGKMIRYPRNDIFTTPSDAIAYVRNNIGLYRTLNFGQGGLYAEMGSAFQIQEVTSMNQGVLPAYQDYFYSAVNLDNSQPSSPRGAFPSLWQIQDTPLLHKFNWQALDFLGIKYVLLPSEFVAYKDELVRRGLRSVYETPATVVFENPNVLPRAFSIHLKNDAKVSEIVLPANYRQLVHEAIITDYRNAAVEISGSAAEEILIVLTDNWHQKWKASLNGTDVPIVKVNGTFRGVFVSKGDYVIKMKYQPGTLPLAICFSSGILLLLVAMLYWRRQLDTLIYNRCWYSHNSY